MGEIALRCEGSHGGQREAAVSRDGLPRLSFDSRLMGPCEGVTGHPLALSGEIDSRSKTLTDASFLAT